MTQILGPCIPKGFPKEVFHKTPNTSLVGTQVFVAQCSFGFAQNCKTESKFKSGTEKKKNHKTSQISFVSVLTFEFGCLQEEIKIQFELQTVSTFSAAQIQDAGLK